MTVVSSLCIIEINGATCTQNGKDVVMRLSASTNAHGELKSQTNYNSVLCCDKGGTSTETCGTNNKNKIFGISAQSNAHGERPEGIQGQVPYSNAVCYDGLENCGFINATLATGEIEVIGLSSDTNAHLADFDYYKSATLGRRVVCDLVAVVLPCELSNARWTVDETFAGTGVTMVVDGANCQGKEIQFEVKRGGTSCSGISGCSVPSSTATFGTGDTSVSTTWTSGPADTEEYSFTASVVGSSSISASTSSTLLVRSPVDPPVFCTDPDTAPSFCSDYTNETYCNSNICTVDPQDSVAVGTTCGQNGVTCSCQWSAVNSTCRGAVTIDPPEIVCGNDVIETGEICDGALLGLSDNSCTAFDDYTGGTVSCSSNCLNYNFTLCTPGSVCGNGVIEPPEQCDDGNTVGGDQCSPTCTDITPGAVCNNGAIETGEICDGALLGLSDNSCTAFDDYTGGTVSCSSNCLNYNFTLCNSPSCGNGVLEPSNNEQCDDGNNQNGDLCTSTCQIVPITLSSITISPTSATLNIGNSTMFDVVAHYSDGTQIANPSGFTCAGTGSAISKISGYECKFTAISNGQATVTASYTEGSITKTAQATIQVTSIITLSHIDIDPESKEIGIGSQQIYSSTLYWSNSTTQTVTATTTFTSSNNSIATISGSTATGVAAGSVNITGSHVVGGTTLTDKVYLDITTSPPILISLAIGPTAASSNIGVNTTFNVVAIYNDNTLLANPPGFSCVSSDTSVAEKVTAADSDCKFIAKALGSATITASYTEGSVSRTAQATLQVTSSVVSSHIELSPLTRSMKVGKQQNYTSRLFRSDGTNQDVTSGTTFTSSNSSVATVSGFTATGVAAGATEIRGAHVSSGSTFNSVSYLGVSRNTTGGGGGGGGTPTGTCLYTPNTADTCEDDGLLTVTWTTEWIGATGSAEWQKCVSAPPTGDNGLQESVTCPAQIQLPFFTIYNLLTAMMVIALIYLAMHIRRVRKR